MPKTGNYDALFWYFYYTINTPAEVVEFFGAAGQRVFGTQTQAGHETKKAGKKRVGKREEDFSRLPRQQRFLIDTVKLDQLYEKGNWRIAHWHRHRTIEHNPAVAYVLETYTPAISTGLEHELVPIPYDTALLSRSFASASLVAEICYQKYFLSLPLYRQEISFADSMVPSMNSRMKDAINYSPNQKVHLCRFLDDGNIPIDNSAVKGT